MNNLLLSSKKKCIEKAVAELIEKYQSDDFALEMVEISNGYRFMTKGAHIILQLLHS